MNRRIMIGILTLALPLTACTRPVPGTVAGGGSPTASLPDLLYATATSTFTVPLPPTRGPGTPIVTPTPDNPHLLPTPRSETEEYVAQFGDTLGGIAERYALSLETLMQANGLSDPNSLDVGQALVIPVSAPSAEGAPFKIIPDSELVYGPYSATLDPAAFIESQGGFLAGYTELVGSDELSAAQIVTWVAQHYSVNPRLLIALIEHQSGWVSGPGAPNTDFPLGYVDAYHAGLFRQLTWAANELNRGYYLWRVGAVYSWVLADGTVVTASPNINAGTAAVQHFFSKLDGRAAWDADVSLEGLFTTYFYLFGFPFDYAIEPLLPPALKQPVMQLPFAKGETWAFTGGPHGGWDTGSGWAALDFAPPGEAQGCIVSEAWVLAAADGMIVRTGEGVVIQDLDGDGYEQTGWTLLYMHVESRERVEAGTFVKAGDRIGHPSCEGGFSNGTHLHLARRYNGEWVPADGPTPFALDGWVSSGTGNEYDGFLRRGAEEVEAWDGNNPLNQIAR